MVLFERKMRPKDAGAVVERPRLSLPLCCCEGRCRSEFGAGPDTSFIPDAGRGGRRRAPQGRRGGGTQPRVGRPPPALNISTFYFVPVRPDLATSHLGHVTFAPERSFSQSKFGCPTPPPPPSH